MAGLGAYDDNTKDSGLRRGYKSVGGFKLRATDERKRILATGICFLTWSHTGQRGAWRWLRGRVVCWWLVILRVWSGVLAIADLESSQSSSKMSSLPSPSSWTSSPSTQLISILPSMSGDSKFTLAETMSVSSYKALFAQV